MDPGKVKSMRRTALRHGKLNIVWTKRAFGKAYASCNASSTETKTGFLLVNLGFSGLPENQRQFNSYRSLWGIWGLYQNFVHTSNLSGRTVCPEIPKPESKNKKKTLKFQIENMLLRGGATNPSFSKNKNV